jgi:predicted DNA-binding protein with PD1-like motif
MKVKPVFHGEERIYVIVCDEGDEAISSLTNFARQNGVSSSHFSAIGAFRSIVLGYFDVGTRSYKKIPVEEQVEVLSLIGNIALRKGEPVIHGHIVVGTSDGHTRGGHLIQGYVRPTLQIIITELPSQLQRHMDEKSGLPLIRL